MFSMSSTGKIFFGALAGYVGVNVLNKFLESRAQEPAQPGRPAGTDGLTPLRIMVAAGDFTGFVAECRRIDTKMSVADMTLLWEGLQRSEKSE